MAKSIRSRERTPTARVKSTGTLLTLGETTRTVAEWSRHTGLEESTILKRLERGWTVEDSLGRPARRRRSA